MVRKIQERLNNQKKHHGMTLVEVMVGILLISTALMFIFLLFTRGMNSLKHVNRKILLVQLAQSKMEDYIADRSISKTGDFSSKNHPEFKYKITVTSYGNPILGLKLVEVKVWDRVRSVTFSNVMTP
ncbi:MAG: type II secretion system protein [Candidatus Eremiobacteraeota bacterium]|nr:type II secretion system protein [Candidatus Eremiobacteraeota bacterium]